MKKNKAIKEGLDEYHDQTKREAKARKLNEAYNAVILRDIAILEFTPMIRKMSNEELVQVIVKESPESPKWAAATEELDRRFPKEEWGYEEEDEYF